MRFWDASAIVPLLVSEADSERRLAQLAEDPVMIVGWASRVECASALARKARGSGGSEAALRKAAECLDRLVRSWVEVVPLESVRSAAERCLRLHPLRTADAFQLAAALVECRFEPRNLSFVCADNRLAAAAGREGFNVVR
jgi:hypothetical protein